MKKRAPHRHLPLHAAARRCPNPHLRQEPPRRFRRQDPRRTLAVWRRRRPVQWRNRRQSCVCQWRGFPPAPAPKRHPRHPPEARWRPARKAPGQRKPGPQEPSPVYYRGILYALNDNGVLVALDGKTGRELYRQRLGGACNSSPIAANGRVYCSNNDGATYVIKAGPALQLLATNQLAERITASPAIARNQLIYPTDSHLYSIGL